MAHMLSPRVLLVLALVFLGLGSAVAIWILPGQVTSAAPQPIANSAMAQRLRDLAHGQQIAPAAFTAEALVAFYRQIEPPPDLRSRVRLQVQLAQALLAAGDTGPAITEFLSAQQSARQQPALFEPGFEREIRSLVAIAYLRLGEQQNCLSGHRADSCLFPIQAGGVHQLRNPAAAARDLYLELLEDDPQDLLSRWLLNVAVMALGEYPQGVPPVFRLPERVLASNDSLPAFRDIAPDLGVDLVTPSGGVVMEDFDHDGYLDLLVSSWDLRHQLRSFRNRGNGTFEETTADLGLAGITGGLNLMQADFDNDGYLDVLVLRGAWLGRQGAQPNSLLRNLGGEGFEDVTQQAGLLDEFPTQAAAWGDFDGDGLIDLFVGNEGTLPSDRRSRLHRNLGDGRFADVAAEQGVTLTGFVKSAVWGDFDDDGLIDLYVSLLDAPNRLYRNRGAHVKPRFEEVAAEAGVELPLNGFSACVLDADNDGRQDLLAFSYPGEILSATGLDYIADFLGLESTAEPARFYRNAGALSFQDAGAAGGLQGVFLAMGLNIGDIDGDGFLDLYLGTGAPDFRSLVPNRMFRNERGLRFVDVTNATRLGHLQKGHGIAFGDVDGDGDSDIYAVLGGAYSGDVYPNALFENQGTLQQQMVLRLEGSTANRAAIGARVQLQVRTGNTVRQIHRTIGSGCSFGANSLRLEIAIEKDELIEWIEVRWPDGSPEQRLPGPDRQGHWRLRQGEPALLPFEPS